MCVVHTVKLLQLEQESEQEINDIKGCRSGENTVQLRKRRTGGTMVLMTASGFVLSLSPILRTESPTEVLLRIVRTVWMGEDYLEMFCRFCTNIGYDMMCNMLKRLLGFKMLDMFNEGVKDVQFMCYVFLAFGLHRLFIDRFHSSKHKMKACCETDGVLNYYNIKFKHLMHKINDNICEQFWVCFNKLKSAKVLGTERFNIMLLLKRELENDDRKRALEKEGYTWEPVRNWMKLYDLSEDNFKEWLAGVKADKYEPFMPTWDKFIIQQPDEHSLSNVQRETFKLTFAHKYVNIWNVRSSEWKVDVEWQSLLRHIHFGIGPYFLWDTHMNTQWDVQLEVEKLISNGFDTEKVARYGRAYKFILDQYIVLIQRYWCKYQKIVNYKGPRSSIITKAKIESLRAEFYKII